MAELENKYSRFYRDTGIDLHAEIAAGGSEGGLENYYTKTETDGLLEDKADDADLAALDARIDELETNPGGEGVTDHGALTGLADDDHTQYLNNTRGDARYYTKTQVDASLSGKSDTNHNHDSRYFTEAEVTTFLSEKADNSTVDGLDERVTDLEESTPDVDLSDTPRFLLYNGGWPTRGTSPRATFFIGGNPDNDAPEDINLAAGDLWVPFGGEMI